MPIIRIIILGGKMHKASNLVNRAHLFSKLRFWKKAEQPVAHVNELLKISFTKHMVALVTKLVMMRASDGAEEFSALCKVFVLTEGVRHKLLDIFRKSLRDPLPAEHHAAQILRLYAGRLAQRKEVMERLIRIAAGSRSLIGRDEYKFLESVSIALRVSNQYFRYLCQCYQIEIPSDNPYIILGVNRFASKKDLKRKYHQLVREFHPDTISGAGYSSSEAHVFNQKLSEINRAYSELSLAA